MDVADFQMIPYNFLRLFVRNSLRLILRHPTLAYQSRPYSGNIVLPVISCAIALSGARKRFAGICPAFQLANAVRVTFKLLITLLRNNSYSRTVKLFINSFISFFYLNLS